jgi:dipeptidyl aminopeptidase/acylaminoacyl peptidase
MPSIRRPFLIVATFTCATVAFGQTYPQTNGARPMRITDLIAMPRYSGATLSPDGKTFLYSVSTTDWKANKTVSHIWRMNADGTEPRQLTFSPDGESGPRWSPDGKWFAFSTKRPLVEGSQIYLMPMDGGEARPLTKHKTGPGGFFWSPDSKWIYFTAPEPKTSEEEARDKAKDDVIDFEQGWKYTHLWKVSVTDGTTQKLTNGDFSVSGPRLSRDGTKLVFLRVANPLIDYAPEAEVYVMSTNGGEMTRVTTNNIGEGSPDLSPDNSMILFVSDVNAKLEYPYNRKLFVVPTSGGPPRALDPNSGYATGSASWSKDGKSIYFFATHGVRSQLMNVDVASGKVRALLGGERVLGGEYLAGRDEFVLTIDTPHSPSEVYMYSVSGGEPRRITHWWDHLARDYKLPRTEAITWKGADGVTIEGILFYPLDYQKGQRYPLVAQTHGGPHSADQLRFPGGSDYVQVLTAMGYAVLKPNYRGSTGYGDDFMRDMIGHYFVNAHKDVMAGVDHLIAIGIADPDKLATMGWSAGGHMTNKLITYTDRFKAASSGAGASNWISMYAQSDVRTYRTPWFGGTPWSKEAPIEAYWEHSPLKYAGNVKTPTLFLFGQNDERVPPQQGIEMYRALKSNGVPTHLYLAPREGHGWGELRHQLYKANVELDWFEKYVTKRTYQWEKYPSEESKPQA